MTATTPRDILWLVITAIVALGAIKIGLVILNLLAGIIGILITIFLGMMVVGMVVWVIR